MRHRWTLASIAAGLAVAAAIAPPARAAELSSLLAQPPQLFTFKLDDHATTRLTLLESFHEAALEHPGGSRRYLAGAFGRWRAEPWWTLAWLSADRDPPAQPEAMALDDGERLFGFEPREAAGSGLAFAPDPPPLWIRGLSPRFATTGPTLASNGFDALWSLPPSKPIPNWRCRRHPVRFVRYGAETESFPLLKCDGAVATSALDRLSFMARVPDAARDGDLLPDEPDPVASARGEWIPGVRVVNPRMLWVLQRVADAFPWKTIYIFSGYRPKPAGAKAGGHHSMHGEARAMDISVMGVPNAALFEFCHTLDDVGCGFYPNSKFVHVDVRNPGTGRAFWIDISGPGEPSHYVDSWPGVIEAGALVWDASRRGPGAGPPGPDASCTRRASDP